MKYTLHKAARVALVLATAALGTAAHADSRGYGRAGTYYEPTAGSHVIFGDRLSLPSGGTAYTWARVNPQGRVQEVGVNIPRQLIWNPPAQGTGPAGSFLVLNFPEAVKGTTFFDHFEAHWEPNGHPPAIFEQPHFDFHFYGIPESEVWGIVPPDTVPPAPDMLPPGYFFPGVDQAVPQMGTHAVNLQDMSGPFTATMILGYWHGAMTFIEPMITRQFLMTRRNIVLPIARPQYLSRTTDYPAVFQSFYNPRTASYEMTFRGFSVIGTPPSAG